MLHGCVVLLGKRGVFIRGASGSGKTRLAGLLVSNWQERNLFARWVVDDQVGLKIHSGNLIAHSPKTIEGLTERRYFGIEPVLFEQSARLDFVVDLVPQNEMERMPSPHQTSLLEGTIALPTICVPEKDTSLAFEITQTFLQNSQSRTNT